MIRNKRSIPAIRARLRELAEESGIEELHVLADEMYRKSPIRRASNRSKKLTPKLAAKIRQHAKKNPHLHQRDLAQEFNVNPGRVSEALNNLV